MALELIDAKTGEPLPGIVQVLDAAGKGVELSELVNRGQGIEKSGRISQLVGPAQAHDAAGAGRAADGACPRRAWRPRLATQSVDLTGQTEATLRVPLVRFYQARPRRLPGRQHAPAPEEAAQAAGRPLFARSAAGRRARHRVRVVPGAGRGRPGVHQQQVHARTIWNGCRTGIVHFGHGEEHRHNFGSHGEGYGHILLLDIPYIIHPVSIGPGITKAGPDSPPLQPASTRPALPAAR